jgi:hypothetical protein
VHVGQGGAGLRPRPSVTKAQRRHTSLTLGRVRRSIPGPTLQLHPFHRTLSALPPPLAPCLRQSHRAAEKIFIDYAGLTVDIVDPETSQVHPAQIFIAVLGASNYTFAEATWTQSLPDLIGSHTRALAFIGGVPEIAVARRGP